MSAEPLFGDTLVHEGEMVLLWRPLQQPPENSALLAVNRANEELLHVMTALESSHGECFGEEENAHSELADLEFKINLLLSLVGELVAGHLKLPDPVPVRFNARAVAWHGEPLPESGQLVELSLYAHAGLPRPLRLTGRVARRGADLAVVALDGVRTELADLIHKYVFRQHRRGVALARARRGR